MKLSTLRNDAENLTTNTFFTCLAIAHNARGRRNDSNAEAAQYLRQVFLAAVYTQTRATRALDLFNDGNALKIFELNGELFLGAFTTFSTFSIETLNLLEQADYAKAVANMLISVLACVGAAFVGVMVARQL